jgi:FtsP/CotA-like multicopper oxidase with cupredoxin domain
MTRPRLVVAGLVVCCWLLAGCGGDDSGGAAAATTVATTAGATSTTEPTTSTERATTTTTGFEGTLIEARVTGDKVDTAERRVRVKRGDKVRIRVQSDHAEEVHVHGFDLSADVAPGKPATIEFTADAAGVFEVELEQAALKLFDLQVQ